jgi:hypothetical protein
MFHYLRVRDCSGKPTARAGFVSRQGEDLQRKARAAGNAIIFIQVVIEYRIRIALGCRKPPGCGPYAWSTLKQVCFN